MKQFFTRSLCFLMALQVLLSSTGFAATEHWCAVKGKKTFLFAKPKSCCGVSAKHTTKSQKSGIKREKCCKDQTVFHKLNANASTLKVSQFEFQPPITNFFPTTFSAFFTNVAVVSPRPHPHYTNPAPPASSRQKLVLMQCFLI